MGANTVLFAMISPQEWKVNNTNTTNKKQKQVNKKLSRKLRH